MSIVDLGAGTGSSVRAFADMLPLRQHWTLIDDDPANLTAATAALAVWADHARQDGDVLLLQKGARRIEIITRQHDLAAAPCGWSGDTDLVTASALMDLASAAWIARFVTLLKHDRLPLLATLTANGAITARPAHAAHDAVIAAFHAHQNRDKGFGPSAGPLAASLLEDNMKAAGYLVTAADSPWVLDENDRGLLQTTIDDMAMAVAETGAVPAATLTQWRLQTRAAERVSIGHRDLFARFP
jgi:hypothetical protein